MWILVFHLLCSGVCRGLMMDAIKNGTILFETVNDVNKRICHEHRILNSYLHNINKLLFYFLE